MPRKMSDMPMKGLSSRALGSSSFNRNPRVPQPNRYSGQKVYCITDQLVVPYFQRYLLLILQLCRTDRRKEVGVKLLEITDQPLGYAAMKKKRKQEVHNHMKLQLNRNKMADKHRFVILLFSFICKCNLFSDGRCQKTCC